MSVDGRQSLSESRDINDRVFELAAEVARLVCVEDAQYVDDRDVHRALDLAANELGVLLGLPEPEFADLWRDDDTLGVRATLPCPSLATRLRWALYRLLTGSPCMSQLEYWVRRAFADSAGV